MVIQDKEIHRGITKINLNLNLDTYYKPQFQKVAFPSLAYINNIERKNVLCFGINRLTNAGNALSN